MRLRLHRDDDVTALAEACQDPEIQRYTRVPSPYTEDDARGWISATRSLAKEGSALHLVLADPDDAVIGALAIQGISHTNRRAEIGYWVAPWARGRGVATRGVRMLSVFAFETLPLERLSIFAEPQNGASRAVAESAGFTSEGVLRGWIEVGGDQRDAIAYGLRRADIGDTAGQR